MGITLEWQAEAPGQTEVCYLDSRLGLVDEEVAWLQVSVHDPPLVAVEQTLQDLEYNRASLIYGHSFASLVKILLHVQVEVLED